MDDPALPPVRTVEHRSVMDRYGFAASGLNPDPEN